MGEAVYTAYVIFLILFVTIIGSGFLCRAIFLFLIRLFLVGAVDTVSLLLHKNKGKSVNMSQVMCRHGVRCSNYGRDDRRTKWSAGRPGWCAGVARSVHTHSFISDRTWEPDSAPKHDCIKAVPNRTLAAQTHTLTHL